MFNVFRSMMYREILLYGRYRAAWVMPLLIFLMMLCLFPITLGANANTLSSMAPAIIWAGVTFSLLMSLGTLFYADHEVGFLEQVILSPYSLSGLLLCKTLTHLLVIGFPLWLLSIAGAFSLHVKGEGIAILGISLALGIPILTLIGNLMAALTLGLAQSGVLLAVLALPLMMPVLIFGSSAVHAANLGLPCLSEIYFLAALFVLAIMLIPSAISLALKTSVCSL